MPRKKKPAPTTAELYIQAKRDLEDAQKRVEFYESRLTPIKQQLIAELAGTSGTLERPDDNSDLGVEFEEGLRTGRLGVRDAG